MHLLWPSTCHTKADVALKRIVLVQLRDRCTGVCWKNSTAVRVQRKQGRREQNAMIGTVIQKAD